MTVAVYAGSFDPPTKGHMWMIEQGSKMFDRLIVAVGTNPDKKSRFTAEERVEMIVESISGYQEYHSCDMFRHDNMKNVFVSSFENMLLVKYAKSVNANFLLRGIRDVKDYEYERQMMHINQDICPNITTVFLFPTRDIAEVSSSTVMGMVGFKGWEDEVPRYVPPNVFQKIKERENAKHNRT